MNFEKFTIKSQEVLQKAAEIASGYEQQAIEPGHLLKGILESGENVIPFLFKKLQINGSLIDNKLVEILQSYPKVSGQQPYLSNHSAAVVQNATNSLKDFEDEYVAIEHLILGLLAGKEKVANLLKDAGFEKKSLLAGIKELRGGNSVKDQNAESKYRSLERYSNNLNEMAIKGKIDPVIGRDDEIRRLLQILSRRTKK